MKCSTNLRLRFIAANVPGLGEVQEFEIQQIGLRTKDEQ